MTSAQRYSEYLKTDYWQAVTTAVKTRAKYRCQICNSPHDLNAHHRSYEHRGNELEHLDDLICLCRRCHETFHGKAAPQPVTSVKVVHVHGSTASDIRDVERDMPDGTYFTLTRDLVFRCKTPAGGFTAETLKAFGLPARNCKGWVRRLVGKRIHREDYRRALQGRYMHKH